MARTWTIVGAHLQRSVGVVHDDGVRLHSRILGSIDPLYRAEAAHKVDVRDAVHAVKHRVAGNRVALAPQRRVLLLENLREKVSQRALRYRIKAHTMP